jgi:membrane protease YdiL (CAAX protease family)
MATRRVREVSLATLVTLVVAIGVADVVTTRLVSATWEPFVKIVIVVGLVAWARRGVGLSWAELGFARANVRDGVRWGAAAALVVAGAILLLVAIPTTRTSFLDAKVTADSTAEHVLKPLVAIPLGTVLFEETIFRGVLLGMLLRDESRRRALLVSSVLFGLWHLPPALTDASGKSLVNTLGIVLGTMAVTTFAGVAFAWLRLRSGSLVAPILGHIATNSFAYVGALIASQL